MGTMMRARPFVKGPTPLSGIMHARALSKQQWHSLKRPKISINMPVELQRSRDLRHAGLKRGRMHLLQLQRHATAGLPHELQGLNGCNTHAIFGRL